MLITGANGHLGRRLLRRVAERSSPDTAPLTRAAVRSTQAAASLRALETRSECVVVDYRDVDALTRAAEGCHAIVHLVGILRESSGTRYREAHESTAQAIAVAAEKAGVRRIVYLSILGAKADSKNACLASKGRAEAILLARAVPTTVIRLPMVLGADQPAALALKAKAMRRVLPLVRGGAQHQLAAREGFRTRQVETHPRRLESGRGEDGRCHVFGINRLFSARTPPHEGHETTHGLGTQGKSRGLAGAQHHGQPDHGGRHGTSEQNRLGAALRSEAGVPGVRLRSQD